MRKSNSSAHGIFNFVWNRVPQFNTVAYETFFMLLVCGCGKQRPLDTLQVYNLLSHSLSHALNRDDNSYLDKSKLRWSLDPAGCKRFGNYEFTKWQYYRELYFFLK